MMEAVTGEPNYDPAAEIELTDDEVREGLRSGGLLPEGCESITAHAIRLWRAGRGF